MAFTSTWYIPQAENEALTAVLIAAMLSAMGVLTPVQTIVFLLLAVYTLPCEGMPNPNIHTIKYNRDGTIERFKSRFVACGYSQVEGEDYSHSFSATMRATSFRTILALAAGEKLPLEHFDVTNAFTQSDIDSA